MSPQTQPQSQPTTTTTTTTTSPTPSAPDLATLNSQTLNTPMPTVTLPDGTILATGTIGALMINIRTYDTILSRSPHGLTETQIREFDAKFRAAVPMLRKSGLLDVFAPEEWVGIGLGREGEGRGISAGRRRVGEICLEMGV